MHVGGNTQPVTHVATGRARGVDAGDPSAVKLYFQGPLPAVACCSPDYWCGEKGQGQCHRKRLLPRVERNHSLRWHSHLMRAGAGSISVRGRRPVSPRRGSSWLGAHFTPCLPLGSVLPEPRAGPPRPTGGPQGSSALRLRQKPESSFLVTQVRGSEVCGRDGREGSRGGSYGSQTAPLRDTRRFADGRSAPWPV